MKDPEILKAIALAMNWTITPVTFSDGSKGFAVHNEEGVLQCRLPYFVEDLNAMHMAEKTLSAGQAVEYGNRLYDIACKEQALTGKWMPYSVSARQRAEAFLKTLGKWEEGK